MSDAFQEGAAAGRAIDKGAADCPHPPTDTTGSREAWLKGFSSTRGTVSPSSDPRQARDAREPEGGTRATTGPKHEA